MNYFCTKCQTRHDIADIGINLYDALISDIRDNVQNIFAGIFNELEDKESELYVLRANVLKFLGDRKKVEDAFIFSGGAIPRLIEDAQWSGSTVKGKFTLSFGWLLGIYDSTGTRAEDEQKAADDDNGLNPLSLEEIPDSAKGKNIYSDVISFSYDNDIRQRGEWLFDHAADKNGDPFSAEAYTPDGRLFRKMNGYVRVCAHCGKPVAAAVGRAPEIVVALAGVNRAGKTCCVAAIASDLYSGKFEQYGITYKPTSYDYEMEWLENQVKNRYDKGIVVDKTNTMGDGSVDEESCHTYSMEVHFGNQRRVLTMVDMPGEFFGTGEKGKEALSPGFFKQYMGLYGAIDFIWFFVGKPVAYQLPLFDLEESGASEVSALYPSPELSPDPNIWRIMDESSDSYTQVKACNPGTLSANLNIIREGLLGMGKKMPPILVVMTKSELIIDNSERDILNKKQIFPPHAVDNFNRRNIENILKKDYSGYYIDEQALFMSGSNTRDLFGMRANRFISAIENQFEHRFYTAISSYGHAAEQNLNAKNAPRPTPYNELMPLIWTLAVSGAAKIRKGCEWEKKNLFGFKTEPEKGTADVVFNSQAFTSGMKPQAENKKATQDMVMLWDTAARNLLFKGTQIGKPVRYYPTTFPHKKG